MSITMEADFCVEALGEALARYGKPEIFNTDQGSQFTSLAFTSVLLREEIAISMDDRGAWRDNVDAGIGGSNDIRGDIDETPPFPRRIRGSVAFAE